MPESNVRCFWHRKSRGFFLPDLLAAVLLLTVTASIVAGLVCNCLLMMRSAAVQNRIQHAARFILNAMEHDLGREATLITILPSGNLSLKTVCGNKQITFTHERTALYKRIKTSSGTGVNPLFHEDVLVKDWHVEYKGQRQVAVSLVLEKDGKKQEYYRLINCANAEVVQSE